MYVNFALCKLRTERVLFYGNTTICIQEIDQEQFGVRKPRSANFRNNILFSKSRDVSKKMDSIISNLKTFPFTDLAF